MVTASGNLEQIHETWLRPFKSQSRYPFTTTLRYPAFAGSILQEIGHTMLSNRRGIKMDACIHRQYLDRLLLELTRAENRTKSTQTVELKLTSTRGSRDMGPTSTSWRAFSPPRSEEVAVGRCAAVSDAARHRGCSINGRRRLPLLAAQHLSGAAPEGVRHDAIQQGVEGGVEEQHYLSEQKDDKNKIKHLEVYVSLKLKHESKTNESYYSLISPCRRINILYQSLTIVFQLTFSILSNILLSDTRVSQ